MGVPPVLLVLRFTKFDIPVSETIVTKTVVGIATLCLLAVSVMADPPAIAPTTAPAAQPAVALPRVAIPNGLNFNGNFGGRSLDSQRRRLINQQQILETLPITASHKLDDLFKFFLADGLLQTELITPDFTPGQTRISIEGSTATWLVQVQTVGFPAMPYINLSRYDFDQTEEGQIWSVSMHRSDAYMSINAQGLGASVTFHQSNGVVMLIVMQFLNGRNRPVLRLDAPSLLQLQADHPEEVRQYLLPMLTRLGGADVLHPGAADVYTVFNELPPSSEVILNVKKQLPRLDSEAFPERDAASAALLNLGRAGVQAALRLDRHVLSFEQVDRIDAIVERERHRLIDDPATMRRDVYFLLDCLEDTDPAVRVAAQGELEKVAGHRVIFEVSAEPNLRAAAVEELRALLKQESESKAATQPN